MEEDLEEELMSFQAVDWADIQKIQGDAKKSKRGFFKKKDKGSNASSEPADMAKNKESGSLHSKSQVLSDNPLDSLQNPKSRKKGKSFGFFRKRNKVQKEEDQPLHRESGSQEDNIYL